MRLIGKKATSARNFLANRKVETQSLEGWRGSYLASHNPREVLGFGARTKIDRLEIHWPPPSGHVETFTDLPINRYITIVEGSGTLASPSQAQNFP